MGKKMFWQNSGLLAVGVCSSLLTNVGTAGARTINVNTTNTGWPTGFCSGPPSGTCCGLRQAIQAVNTQAPAGGCPAGDGNNDTIVLRTATYVATSSFTIERPVVIDGNGIGSTIIRGNMATDSAAFFVNTGPEDNVKFVELSVDRTSGNPFVTGIYAFQTTLWVQRARVAGFTRNGIIGDDITLFMEDSTIENNSSLDPGGGIQINELFGGNNAGFWITRSTIANNTSNDVGGGMYHAGEGNATIENSTISGNSATAGGGIYQPASAMYLILDNVTVAQNSASSTGGGLVLGKGMYSFDSIIGQNIAHTNIDVDGNVPTFRQSLISDSLGALINEDDQEGSLIDVWPDLDPVLRSLGGFGKVHRPFPGSPVIDAYTPGPGDLVDQRGVKRPQFGRSNAALADMGAFESSRLESESLAVAAVSSGVPHVTVSGSQYSNGQGKNLQATAINRFVTYSTTSSLPAGTYNVTIGYKKGSNAGRFQFGVSTSSGGTFTPVGGSQEGYSSSSSWVTVNLGNITLSSSGTKFFRFFVTGKHTSSSSYQVFPDFVDFTKLN